MNDLYSILGLAPNASVSEIKKAYRHLAKQYHPDVSSNADASHRMQQVNEAYAVLSDPVRKAEYDQMRQMRQAPPPVAPTAASAAATPAASPICCSRCGKVDATLRVSTFTTVWSFVLFSFYKGWAFILCARCRVIKSLQFNTQVLLFGWWGIPWGPVWSISSLIKNSLGGHQPRENNATLLAIVGQNLIGLGDYDEAEQALTASLALKEDPEVIRLLQIAKSRAGYKRRPPFTARLMSFESHPVFYNFVLIFVFCGLLAGLGFVGGTTAVKAIATTSPTPSSFASGTNSEPPLTWWQKMSARINLARGLRWGLPVQLGDTRAHVYEVLGDPAPDTDPSIGPMHHIGKLFNPDESTQYWPDKGLSVTFRNGVVSSIYAAGDNVEGIAKVPYRGELYYGVHAGDDLPTMYSRLGQPYSSTSDGDCAWRFGTTEITEELVTSPQTSGDKTVAIGHAWGGTTITDIRPQLEAEADAKAERARVTLTGAALSAQEINDKYKNRIFIVTAFDSHGQPVSLGTGFQFRDNLIATNYHVVQNARKLEVKLPSDADPVKEVSVMWIAENDENSTAKFWNGKPFLGDRSNDWAILRANVPELPEVQTGGTPATGEPITVIGNPEGFSGSVTTGVVSSMREDGWIQMSAPISHGSSGSPVFDSTGHWLGLATLTDEEGQNLNFATPASVIAGKVREELADIAAHRAIGMDASMPLREALDDPLLRAIDARGDKDPAEIQQTLSDFATLLKNYADPDDQSFLLSQLETVYEDDLGDYKNALETCKKRIEIDPNSYQVWEQYGKLLGSKFNDQSNAVTCFQKSIQLAQSDIQSDLEKNKKKFDDSQYQGESDEMRKVDQQTLDASNSYDESTHASQAVEIGRMYLLMGNINDGVTWLKTAKAWARVPIDSMEADQLLAVAAKLSQQQANSPTPSSP